MNAEEKQALTGLCKIEIKRWKAASESNPNMRYMVELMEVALTALKAQPVLYALRFKNHHGQPDKLINENCLFRSHEKASQYGKGGNYVTQASGKIEWVPNPQLDPEVVPLYQVPSFSD